MVGFTSCDQARRVAGQLWSPAERMRERRKKQLVSFRAKEARPPKAVEPHSRGTCCLRTRVQQRKSRFLVASFLGMPNQKDEFCLTQVGSCYKSTQERLTVPPVEMLAANPFWGLACSNSSSR